MGETRKNTIPEETVAAGVRPDADAGREARDKFREVLGVNTQDYKSAFEKIEAQRVVLLNNIDIELEVGGESSTEKIVEYKTYTALLLDSVNELLGDFGKFIRFIDELEDVDGTTSAIEEKQQVFLNRLSDLLQSAKLNDQAIKSLFKTDGLFNKWHLKLNESEKRAVNPLLITVSELLKSISSLQVQIGGDIGKFEDQSRKTSDSDKKEDGTLVVKVGRLKIQIERNRFKALEPDLEVGANEDHEIRSIFESYLLALNSLLQQRLQPLTTEFREIVVAIDDGGVEGNEVGLITRLHAIISEADIYDILLNEMVELVETTANNSVAEMDGSKVGAVKAESDFLVSTTSSIGDSLSLLRRDAESIRGELLKLQVGKMMDDFLPREMSAEQTRQAVGSFLAQVDSLRAGVGGEPVSRREIKKAKKKEKEDEKGDPLEGLKKRLEFNNPFLNALDKRAKSKAEKGAFDELIDLAQAQINAGVFFGRRTNIMRNLKKLSNLGSKEMVVETLPRHRQDVALLLLMAVREGVLQVEDSTLENILGLTSTQIQNQKNILEQIYAGVIDDEWQDEDDKKAALKRFLENNGLREFVESLSETMGLNQAEGVAVESTSEAVVAADTAVSGEPSDITSKVETLPPPVVAKKGEEDPDVAPDAKPEVTTGKTDDDPLKTKVSFRI